MARPWIRRIGRIAIATIVVVVAALACLWATTVLWGPRWWLDLSTVRTVLAIAILVLVALAAVLAAIWWLWWRLPRRQVRMLEIQIHDPKARADTEDNFRKTVGQALGGAAVLIGAVIAYLQFTQQQQASHDLLISNQVSKGFEQLASDKIAERLGGIYALEGVMNTSEQYHQPVLEALCAFVRESTTRQKGPLTVLLETFTAPRHGTAGKDPDKPPNDIQAALTVIGRRKAGLGDAFLAGAKISGADLTGADLTGVNLRGSDLTGANLSFADLTGANLSFADLTGANLSFANMSGAYLLRADLTGANLRGANLGIANLSIADLSGANLGRADLLGTDLGIANLTGADLTDAHNLTDMQLDEACGKPKSLPPGLILDKPCPPPSTPK
jgi:uncharacterized protein YjbI with pentapeptide repeats